MRAPFLLNIFINQFDATKQQNKLTPLDLRNIHISFIIIKET